MARIGNGPGGTKTVTVPGSSNYICPATVDSSNYVYPPSHLQNTGVTAYYFKGNFGSTSCIASSSTISLLGECQTAALSFGGFGRSESNSLYPTGCTVCGATCSAQDVNKVFWNTYSSGPGKSNHAPICKQWGIADAFTVSQSGFRVLFSLSWHPSVDAVWLQEMT